MELLFATPEGALVGAAGVLALAALAVVERRATLVRRALRLRPPPRRSWLADAGAITLVAALVALAAAQPILLAADRVRVRGDGEVYVVLDTSRSMLAAASPRAATRFDRARDEAMRLRAALPGVRVGLASLTDRLLPHLFPTTRADVYAATLARAVDENRPPPRFPRLRATTFVSLADAPTWNFFSTGVGRRLLVVFTDGEGQETDPGELRYALRGQPRVEILLVHVWSDRERVFSDGRPERSYVPDARSRDLLERLAEAGHGAVFAEDEQDALASAVRRRIGSSSRTAATTNRRADPLAPYALAAAFLPLGLLLWRRNRV